MGNQVSSAPTPSHDYQECRYGGAAVAAAAAANMENHGAPQKLQRPNLHKSVISSDEAVRIYGGICVTEIYVADKHRSKELHLLSPENALEVAKIAPSALPEGVDCTKKNLLHEEEDDF